MKLKFFTKKCYHGFKKLIEEIEILLFITDTKLFRSFIIIKKIEKN